MNKTEKQVSWKRTLYILFFAQLMLSVSFSSVFPFLPLFMMTTKFKDDFFITTRERR